jgi:hypothetical protein
LPEPSKKWPRDGTPYPNYRLYEYMNNDSLVFHFLSGRLSSYKFILFI